MTKRPKEITEAISKAEPSTLDLIRHIEKERDDHVANMSAQIKDRDVEITGLQEALNKSHNDILTLKNQCDQFKSEMVKAQDKAAELQSIINANPAIIPTIQAQQQ